MKILIKVLPLLPYVMLLGVYAYILISSIRRNKKYKEWVIEQNKFEEKFNERLKKYNEANEYLLKKHNLEG
jgi:uncharacterized membrane protein YbaN (DUF454 family)